MVLNTKFVYAKQDIQSLFERGIKHAKGKTPQKGVKYFKRVVNASYGHYPSYYNLSLLSLLKEDYKKALSYLKKSKTFNPFDLRIDQMLSLTHLVLKDYEESKKSITEITSKKPGDIDAHKKLGIIHLNENSISAAIGEFTLVRNLSPSDVNGNLLLGIAYARNMGFKKALEKIKNLKEELTDDKALAFYALVLEKNNLQDEADTLYKTIQISDKEKIVADLMASLEGRIIQDEISGIPFIEKFENPDVSRRIAKRLEEIEMLSGEAATEEDKAMVARLFNFKGTLTHTFELYDRSPKGTSPINALSTISNLKLEGKTSTGVSLKVEWEGFYNRWDNTKSDFFKINATQRNKYEVDVGKFSAKHFPTLVSFPTVLEGVRLWTKTTLPEFKPTEAHEITEEAQPLVNLGEVYRQNRIDDRSFKDVEITMLSGWTLKQKNVDDRKEKNDMTLETSGQFDQWTQSYRVHSQINSVLEVGTSLAVTQDANTRDSFTSSSTLPVKSVALGIDGGIDLLDKDLTLDAELAMSDYDLDTIVLETKNQRDIAWIIKSKYKFYDTVSITYEQKAVGKNFKVEGASQTQDKITHTANWVYKPKDPKTWSIQSQTFKWKPEGTNLDGGSEDSKYYRTFQSVTDVKLPQNAKFTSDYKYYKEKDKCGCSGYKTLTFKNSLDWTIAGLKTTLKPSYTFERKDDMATSPTDEKKKEYMFSIKNKSIKNLELDYAFEREVKKFNGATTKAYRQYIHSFEAKYTFIPSRLDAKIKASQDYKNPSDTNKTDIDTVTFELNYTSKDRNDKFNLKYERKHNTYLPWSDSSAYRQNYIKAKYTKKF